MQMYVVVDNWSLLRDKFGTTIGIAEFGVVVVVWMCSLAQFHSSYKLQSVLNIFHKKSSLHPKIITYLIKNWLAVWYVQHFS